MYGGVSVRSDTYLLASVAVVRGQVVEAALFLVLLVGVVEPLLEFDLSEVVASLLLDLHSDGCSEKIGLCCVLMVEWCLSQKCVD